MNIYGKKRVYDMMMIKMKINLKYIISSRKMLSLISAQSHKQKNCLLYFDMLEFISQH